MKHVFIEDIKSGMILGEDLLNNFNVTVFNKHHVVKDEDIEKIKKLDLLMISIAEEKDLIDKSENNDEAEDSIIEEERKKYFDSFKDNYYDIINKYSSYACNLDSSSKDAIEKTANDLISALEKEKSFVEIIKLIRSEDFDVHRHCVNVSIISFIIGKLLKMSNREKRNLVLTGLFHDVGFTCSAKDILGRPVIGVEDEPKHPFHSCEKVKSVYSFENEVIFGILNHHERIDGSGFPRGVKGNDINIYSRILAVADEYDRMTTKSSKGENSPFSTLESLNKMSYGGGLDPKVVDVFTNMYTGNYLGHKVLLSDGRKGKIVYRNKYDKFRPMVKSGDEFIDLYSEYKLNIVDFI